MSGTNLTKIPGDNPILEPDEDLLERTGVIRSFVQGVLELDTDRGAAVGIFAPWGAGKTSFVNLTRKKFKQEDVQVLDFNPWLFSRHGTTRGAVLCGTLSRNGRFGSIKKTWGSIQKVWSCIECGNQCWFYAPGHAANCRDL